MVNVVWTDRSLTDLEDIGEYISKDSLKYAKLTVQKLLLTACTIAKNPLQECTVPESNDITIREIIVGNYRVILTVYHGARNLKAKDL